MELSTWHFGDGLELVGLLLLLVGEDGGFCLSLLLKLSGCAGESRGSLGCCSAVGTSLAILGNRVGWLSWSWGGQQGGLYGAVLGRVVVPQHCWALRAPLGTSWLPLPQLPGSSHPVLCPPSHAMRRVHSVVLGTG